MATLITHRKVNIIVLEPDEQIASHCRPGDIAIVGDRAGWWTRFIGEDGEVDSYDEPFATRNEAIWAAKAAAEYGV